SVFDADAPSTLPVVLHAYGTGTDKGEKSVFKAMTGALKYGLRNAFLIPDESDPEADSSVDKATAAKEVGKKKVADLEAKKTAVAALFYSWPSSHNGNTAFVTGDTGLLAKF